MILRLRNLEIKRKIIIVAIISLILFSVLGKQGVGFEQRNDQLVNAEQGNGCEKVGHYTSYGFSDVIVRDDIAYVRAHQNGYFIVDVSDKTNPTILSHQNLIARTRGISIEDNYAYFIVDSIAWGLDSTLLISDISDPNNPVNVSVTSFENHNYEDIWVEDDYAYLASEDGFYVLDVSNPLTPVVLNSTYIGGDTTSIFLQNEILYVNDYYGIHVYNVSTPANPKLISSYNGSDSGLFPIFGTLNFYVDGQYLYANTFFGLLVINATNTKNLTYCNLLGDWGNLYFSEIEIEGDYIYLPGTILHKNNISHPIQVCEHNITRGGSFDAVGNYLYIALSVLRIVDVTNPADAVLIGELGVFGMLGSVRAVELDGNHAYVCSDYSGLWILDITDLTNPVKVAEYTEHISIIDVKIIGDYAYLVSLMDGLIILDISDPTAPTKINEFYDFEIGGKTIKATCTFEICVQDNYAYFAANDYLLILDISNPEVPVAVGKYYNEFGVERVSVDGNKGYILGDDGLQILNVKDKTNPKKIGNYSTELLGGSVRDLDVSGKYAFIGCRDTVEVLNVGNAADVKSVSSIEIEGRTVCVAGRYICVTSGVYFAMYDMNKPETPVEFTSFWDSESTIVRDPWDLSTRIQEVEVRDGYAFLAHGTNGLVIISLPVTIPGKIGMKFTFTVSTFVTVIAIVVIVTRKKRK